MEVGVCVRGVCVCVCSRGVWWADFNARSEANH